MCGSWSQDKGTAEGSWWHVDASRRQIKLVFRKQAPPSLCSTTTAANGTVACYTAGCCESWAAFRVTVYLARILLAPSVIVTDVVQSALQQSFGFRVPVSSSYPGLPLRGVPACYLEPLPCDNKYRGQNKSVVISSHGFRAVAQCLARPAGDRQTSRVPQQHC